MEVSRKRFNIVDEGDSDTSSKRGSKRRSLVLQRGRSLEKILFNSSLRHGPAKLESGLKATKLSADYLETARGGVVERGEELHLRRLLEPVDGSSHAHPGRDQLGGGESVLGQPRRRGCQHGMVSWNPGERGSIVWKADMFARRWWYVMSLHTGLHLVVQVSFAARFVSPNSKAVKGSTDASPDTTIYLAHRESTDYSSIYRLLLRYTCHRLQTFHQAAIKSDYSPTPWLAPWPISISKLSSPPLFETR